MRVMLIGVWCGAGMATRCKRWSRRSLIKSGRLNCKDRRAGRPSPCLFPAICYRVAELGGGISFQVLDRIFQADPSRTSIARYIPVTCLLAPPFLPGKSKA